MLPGGGPQGAYLSGISEAKATTVKFIDDRTVAVSVDLQLSLIEEPEN